MSVRLAASAVDPASTLRAGAGSPGWTCAFVNNMPDGAFDATERQFLDLLEAASGPDEIVVHRYALEGVDRGERTALRIAQQYSSLGALQNSAPDILIVTGSNPVQARIDDEPYWDDLVGLLSWASEHVSAMLLSCLAAHTALSVFDDAERIHLATKCTGVFTQHVDTSHPLNAGLESEILLPHSRTNSVLSSELREAGYRVAIQSDEVGWSVATRDINECSVVLVQGHPEYDPSSLLREYRRDVGRYVRHERDDLPCLPYHCVAEDDWEELERMHETIISGHRDPSIIAAYPFEEVGDRAPWDWRAMAIRMYANWLASVAQRRD